MKKSLTAKQKVVLSTVSSLTQQHGRPPTLDELRKALKYSSISSVQRHTDALKRKGYLSSGRGLGLPQPTGKIQIPLVGNVSAGVPFFAIENIEAYVPFDSSKLRGNPKDYFLLRAIGDSMNAADIDGKNIDDGDLVLVKKQPSANIGERVVALLGEEATIKRFSRGKEFIELRPESTNPQNKPIYVYETLSIQGVICDVIKKGDKSWQIIT